MEGYLVRQLIHYCNISVSRCQPIEPQKIPFYDLTFVLDGEMTYHVNGTIFHLQKHDAVFLPPGTLRIREASTEPVSYVSFNFHLFEGQSLPFSTYLPDCITPSIRRLVSVYPTSHLSSLHYSREKCIMLLNYILYELLDEASFRSDNDHVLKILRYIEEHIREKITLQTISQQMNLSREYTSYLFKREMNKTLTDYINERKLLLARELITDYQIPLHDVAQHLGFDHYNYFCRLYKRQFEMSPGSMRKKHRATE